MPAGCLISRLLLFLCLLSSWSGCLYADQPGSESGGGLPRRHYVSLGSSYAAGPDVGIKDIASGPCNRSQSNFARLLAKAENLSLTDASCVGATTDNILYRGQYGNPPQIEAVNADTDLVTILIGGNDVDYVGALTGLSCLNSPSWDSFCDIFDLFDLTAKVNALQGKVEKVLNEVKMRAPNATIVLVGYLRAVPLSGFVGCDDLQLNSLSVEAVNWLKTSLEVRLNAAAIDTAVYYLPAGALSVGHDVCSHDPYVNGYRHLAAADASWTTRMPLHPNRRGMQFVADRLARYLHFDTRFDGLTPDTDGP